ncbi:MAG: hypothetical protein VYC71_15725, partial [Planctomycetota bacterium]|nr:hypothetical protein [Planctomycetota bacterium]
MFYFSQSYNTTRGLLYRKDENAMWQRLVMPLLFYCFAFANLFPEMKLAGQERNGWNSRTVAGNGGDQLERGQKPATGSQIGQP